MPRIRTEPEHLAPRDPVSSEVAESIGPNVRKRQVRRGSKVWLKLYRRPGLLLTDSSHKWNLTATQDRQQLICLYVHLASRRVFRVLGLVRFLIQLIQATISVPAFGLTYRRLNTAGFMPLGLCAMDVIPVRAFQVAQKVNACYRERAFDYLVANIPI